MRTVIRRIHGWLAACAATSYMQGNVCRMVVCDVLAGALRRLTY